MKASVTSVRGDTLTVLMEDSVANVVPEVLTALSLVPTWVVMVLPLAGMGLKELLPPSPAANVEVEEETGTLSGSRATVLLVERSAAGATLSMLDISTTALVAALLEILGVG